MEPTCWNEQGDDRSSILITAGDATSMSYAHIGAAVSARRSSCTRFSGFRSVGVQRKKEAPDCGDAAQLLLRGLLGKVVAIPEPGAFAPTMFASAVRIDSERPVPRWQGPPHRIRTHGAAQCM
jgi:hypothetical protein